MSEFNDRITAQRKILQSVNSKKWEKEELFGLSRRAINRWTAKNQIASDSRLVELVEAASSRLFFLANKSQEQISEEYKLAVGEIAAIVGKIIVENRR